MLTDRDLINECRALSTLATSDDIGRHKNLLNYLGINGPNILRRNDDEETSK